MEATNLPRNDAIKIVVGVIVPVVAIGVVIGLVFVYKHLMTKNIITAAQFNGELRLFLELKKKYLLLMI